MRLLIVEDEPIVQQLLMEVLGGEADELLIAGGVVEARALAAAGFTVALVDKNLPDGSGLALIGELRRMVPDAAVLLMTAYASLDTAIEALRAGAYDYILKPFSSMQDLVLKVRRAREKVELTRGRAALTEQLHHAVRMESLGRMAGAIAHDFNNVLTVIVTTSQLLATEVPARCQDDLETINAAARSAATLIRQLLTFSRQQPACCELLELNDIIGGIQRLARGTLGPDHQLIVPPAPAECWLTADRGQLEQVLMNLVINARDALERPGTITITTRVVDGAIELAVADTGCGIPDELVARIFEPFFTTKPAHQGTGLGLATVYGIVQGLAGSIDVDSKLGAGTTFRIRLPASAPP